MRRLYISVIVAVLGAIFVIGWGLDLLVDDQDHHHPQDSTATYQRIIDGAANQLGEVAADNLNQQSQSIGASFAVSLSLVDSDSVALPPSLHQQLSQRNGLLLASQEGSYLLKKIPNHPGFLLQLQLPPIEDANHSTDLILTLLLYLGVCIIIILWSLPLTRRLYLLNNTAAKFGAGEFSARLPASRFSYIHLLEHSFNRMAAQIENLMADNKILARSLSHDIRTPIACLRFGIEAALDSDTIEKKDRYLNRMDSEITRMEQMTSAFLEYAGLERQVGSLTLHQVELNQWLNVVCDELTPFAENQGVKLNVISSDQPSECHIDSQWFHRAIQNLLANAIDFAKGNVAIKLKCERQKVTIMVIDDGPGIPQDALTSIFEPFVRHGHNRTREHGHFGLGLAITHRVLSWHGGTITAGNDQDMGGACFTLTLPLQTIMIKN